MTLVSTIIGVSIVAIIMGFITVYFIERYEPELEELPVETPTSLNHIIHFKNGETIAISKSDHLSLKEKMQNYPDLEMVNFLSSQEEIYLTIRISEINFIKKQ